jgi:lipopolysaccharide transport system permease protein
LRYNEKMYKMTANLKRLYDSRELLAQFTKRDFLQRYKGSNLGFFWAFISPLIMLTIYSFIFIGVFNLKWGDDLQSGNMLYTLMIFCGLIPFNIFAESVNRATVVLPQSANYIKKVVLPVEILPISIVLSTTLNNGFSLLLLVLGKIMFLNTPNWTILFAPLVILPIILFTIGISLFLSAISVYLRDTAYVIGLVINMLFYLSPIFYSTDKVPSKFQFIVKLNPISPMIEQWRYIFIKGELFSLTIYFQTLMTAVIFFIIGLAIFYLLRKGFADVI